MARVANWNSFFINAQMSVRCSDDVFDRIGCEQLKYGIMSHSLRKWPVAVTAETRRYDNRSDSSQK